MKRLSTHSPLNRFRSIALSTVFVFAAAALPAQTWTFQGAGGSANAENSKAVCADASGNIYITGSFSNTVDFDFGAGTANLVSNGSNDIFIASYTAAGAYRWAVRAGGTAADNGAPAGGICTDGTSVYVTGSYNGAATMFGATSLTPNGGAGQDAFVAKLNAATGAWTWAVSYGGTTNLDFGTGMCLDPLGNPYVTGAFNNTMSGACANVSGGGTDLFVMKLNPASGACVWMSNGGSTGNEAAAGGGICYDPVSTEIIVTSCFSTGTATFGAFTIPFVGLNDLCILELNSTTGAWLGAVGTGSAGTDDAIGCAYDPTTGAIMVCGAFSGNITLPGGIPLTNTGGLDAWVGRYSVATNGFVWAKAATGASGDRANAIACDGAGTVVVTGQYVTSPTTFGAFPLTNTNSGGFDDVFVVGYAAGTGTEMWATKNTNSGVQPSANNAKGIAFAGSGNFWITGQHAMGCTFGSLGAMNSNGFNDLYIAKFNAPPPLTATQSQVNLVCNGVCTGSATVVASGGNPPYTYSWSPSGGSGATASSLCATNYTCTITDNVGTSITKTFNITQPPAITSSVVSQTNVACFGGSTGAATITAGGGTGSLTYNWTPGNPTGDGTVSVTNLTAQIWTCTITDANSCTRNQTVNITAPSALVVTPASQTNVSCFGGSNGAASINTPTGGAGGYTYNWTPGNPTGDGTVSVTGLTAGTWTCTVTDANACVATQTFNVTAPTALVVTPASQTNISCFGGSNGAASINTPTGGAGGYTYNWTPGNPTGDGTVSVTGLTAGTWTCTVTDANACVATRTFNITAPTAIVVTPASQTNISCFGGSNGAASINTPTGGAGGYTYNWTPGNPTGDGTVSVTGLTAGTWTCTVTDANACVATQTFNITAPTAIVVTPASQTNVSCGGGSNGAASINTPTGGAGGYTYNWTPGNPTGDGTVSVSGLTAGIWTCTVTDANACVATQTFNITAPSAIVVTPASQTNISCFGGSNGAASINTPTGGAGGYTYNWTPGNPTGDGTVSVTGLTAGTWTCTVTDVNSCTSTQTFNITAPSALVASALSQTNISCFGGSTGAASVSVTGGTTAYSYNWTPGNPTGDGTASVTGLTAGTWTCTVTDANACVTTQTFNITQPTALVASAASQTNVSCFGGSNGAASVSVTGGTTAYSYNWTPGNPTGDGTASVTGLTAGTWTCTVTDANACVATQTFNITAPTAIVVTPASQTNVSCGGGSNGAASINTPTGGAGGYTYNWTPGNPTGDGTVSVSGLTAGTWTCTVTDANACVATQTFNITAPSAIVVTPASQTNISCNGGSNGAASINTPTGGAGGYTYNWTPGNPTGDGTVSVSGLTAGTWTCTVTDANACTSTQTFNITAPSALVASALSQTNISCFGGSTGAASVSVTGGTTAYSYNWTPGNPTGDGTASVTGLTAGTWTCTVTDANACVATRTFNITQPPALVASVASQTNVSCFGGSNGAASVSVTGGTTAYSYNWTPGNPTGDGTASVTGLTAGTWTCTVTDANSCVATQTFNITAPTAIVVTPASQTNVSCNGGSNGAASINTPTGGAGGYTYNWTPGNPTGDGTTSVTGLTAGTWTCTITDANACVTTQTFSLTAPTAIVTTIVSQTNVACNGGNTGAATVSVSGGTPGYTYSWAPSGGTAATATGLIAGCYTVTVTDANGCTRTQTVCITQATALTISATVTNVSCNGGNNGSATVTTLGGTPSYSYSWTPSGGTAATASGLAIGTYTCTVTDANGCTITQSVAITEPAALSSTNSFTDITCFGLTNGTASVSPAGGTSPYTYVWSPTGGTGPSASGLGAGMYTCTITDGAGCILSPTFLINEPSAISPNQMQNNIICAGGGSGHMMVSPSGGTGAFTYAWSPIANSTNALNGSPAGFYTCTITDANGCTATATFNLTEPPALTVSGSQTDISCNGGSDGAATVTVGGGTPGYTYLWTPSGGTNATESGLTAGSYTCTITDLSGCTITETFNITAPSALSSSSMQTDVTCNAGANGDAMVTVTGGTGAYTYLWSPTGGTGSSESGLIAGSYTCVTTDANGCSITNTFNITEPAALSPTAIETDITCFGGSDGAIDITVTGGTAPYTYDWNSGTYTTEDISGLTAGTYSVVVTDANGCTTSGTLAVAQPSAIAHNGVVTNATSCTSGDGMIDLTTLGGTGAFTFVWSNSATTEDLTGLDGGVYSVIITDSNNCTTSATFTITEPGAPTVLYSEPTDTACQTTTAPFSLSGETPAGGTWTGPGVSAGVFDPMTANIGYNVIVYSYTDSAGCSGAASDSIWVDLCMDVAAVTPHNILVYPNPSAGIFTVNADVNSVITVYDAVGNVVMITKSTSAKSEINLSGFANGIYMVTVQTGSTVTSERMVIIK